MGEYKIRYEGSLVWLIFWTVVFFPVAIMLFLTGAYFEAKGAVYRLKYYGSRFWLGLWIIVFFPVAILLLLYHGCGWNMQEVGNEKSENVEKRQDDDTIIIK